MGKLLSIFDTTAEKALAEELASYIVKNVPAKLMSQRRQVLSGNKITRLLEQAFATAKDHQAREGLNFLKRAVLANSFRWQLKQHGYPDDFVRVATEGLVIELSKNSKNP